MESNKSISLSKAFLFSGLKLVFKFFLLTSRNNSNFSQKFFNRSHHLSTSGSSPFESYSIFFNWSLLQNSFKKNLDLVFMHVKKLCISLAKENLFQNLNLWIIVALFSIADILYGRWICLPCRSLNSKIILHRYIYHLLHIILYCNIFDVFEVVEEAEFGGYLSILNKEWYILAKYSKF